MVSAEFVFDRHAGADMSLAYAILVPQWQAGTGRASQEGGLHDQRGDLRSGVVGSAEEGRNDWLPDRGLSAHAQALGFEAPEQWVFEDEGHSGATLVRPALEWLRDLIARGGVDVVLCYSPPPAPPTR